MDELDDDPVEEQPNDQLFTVETTKRKNKPIIITHNNNDPSNKKIFVVMSVLLAPLAILFLILKIAQNAN